MCVCVCVCERERERERESVCVCVCVRERERERERQREREKVCPSIFAPSAGICSTVYSINMRAPNTHMVSASCTRLATLTLHSYLSRSEHTTPVLSPVAASRTVGHFAYVDFRDFCKSPEFVVQNC